MLAIFDKEQTNKERILDKYQTLTQISAFYCYRAGAIEPSKLYSLIYIADRTHLATHASSISGDSYLLTTDGPIPTALSNLVQERTETTDWLAWISKLASGELTLKIPFEQIQRQGYELNSEQVQFLSEAFDNFGSYTAKFLTHYILKHFRECMAPTNLTLISNESILLAQGFTDEMIKNISSPL